MLPRLFPYCWRKRWVPEKCWSWGRFEFLGRTPSDWLASQQQPYQISIWRKVGTKTGWSVTFESKSRCPPLLPSACLIIPTNNPTLDPYKVGSLTTVRYFRNTTMQLSQILNGQKIQQYNNHKYKTTKLQIQTACLIIPAPASLTILA